MPSTSDTTRRPWNLGRFIGPEVPFKPKHIWAIRTCLQPCVGDTAGRSRLASERERR